MKFYGFLPEELSYCIDWAMSWWTGDDGSTPDRGKRCFSSPPRPDRRLSPHSLPPKWVPGFFPGGKVNEAWGQIRIELCLHFSIRFYDVSKAKVSLSLRCLQEAQTPCGMQWNRGLPETLTGPQLVRKFPAFYGTQRFITALTRAWHLPLS